MKPTHSIPEQVLDNRHVFTGPFYDRFRLRHPPQPIQLTPSLAKNYLFPTFYGDVRCAISVCFCSYEKAARLISEKLDPLIRPVRMGSGRAVVAFSCYEYRNVLGVPPYNEIAVAIPIMVNARFNPPILPMVLDRFARFGYYIAAMPVTSHENTLRGNNIWGLPKVTREIDIFVDGTECVTEVREDDGSPCVTLRVPTTGKPTQFDVSSYLYSQLSGRLIRSRTSFQSTFNVTKNMKLLFRKGVRPDRPRISVGAGPDAALLRDLEIEEYPFQFRYAEHMQSCFDLPEEHLPPWASSL